MANTQGNRAWEERLHEAATTVEDELRKVITYLQDEVMPGVRQNSSSMLRSAAVEMEKLAQRIDERARAAQATSDQGAGRQ